jgi:hypothetical protein
MNDFEHLPESEKQLVYLDAMVQYQGIQIALLNECLDTLCRSMGGPAIYNGKTLSEHLAARRDVLMRDKIRTLADHDPAGASRLSSFFEAMKKGGSK